MRWSARLVAGVIAGLLLSTYATMATASADLGARRTPKATVVDNPCTLLAVKQVKKEFGGPVATPLLNKLFLTCKYAVGTDPTQAGGTLGAVLLFPSFLSHTGTAKAAYEDQHAFDMLSNHVITDVNGVGRSAYMNLTNGELVVLATKRFVFTLRWQPAPARPVNARDIKKLTALAKLVVPRFPR